MHRLKNITIGGESALKVGVAVANAAGETFFRHFEDMVPLDITERAGRAAAACVLKHGFPRIRTVSKRILSTGR